MASCLPGATRLTILCLPTKSGLKSLPEEPPLQSTIKAYVNLTAAAGGSNTGEKKIALENADVRLYRISKIEERLSTGQPEGVPGRLEQC